MRTSQHLAAAATHLAQLLRDGQHDLLDPAELASAAQARHDVTAGLGRALQTALTRLDATGGHHDAIQAAWPLARTLADSSGSTGSRPVPGSGSPTVEEPTSSSATAWARAAVEVRSAADQAESADGVSPDQWRAATVDLAALAGSLARLDTDLHEALTAAGHAPTATPDGPDHAAQLAAETLQRQAQAAIAALDADDLVREYHLTPPVLGVAPVTEARHVPIAVRRAVVLLDRSLGLTAAQHTAVAIETAKLAHHLRTQSPTDATPTGSPDTTSSADSSQGSRLDSRVQRFVQAQLGVAHVWSAVAHLSCVHAGSWEPAAQLQAVNDFLAGPAQPQLTAEQAREAVRLLPTVVGSVITSFDEALAREDWIASYRDGDDHTEWTTIWPDYGPEARGLTPADSDFAPVEVHLQGHAVHQAWHDRGIPVDGYRLGDPIEDRWVGAPQATAELHRLYTAMDAATATGRGLLTGHGPTSRDTLHHDVAAAREILASRPGPDSAATAGQRAPGSGQETTQAQKPPRVLAVRGPHDLPDALHRLVTLMRHGERITTDRWKIIAWTAAQAARAAAQTLYRAAAPVPAAALLEHARLLTDAAQAMSPTKPAVYTGSASLSQAQQIRRQLAEHHRAGTLLPPGPALNIARALPALTQALADTADRAAPTRTRRSAPAMPTAFSTSLANQRIAAAVAHAAALNAAVSASRVPRPAPTAGLLSRPPRR